MTFGIGVGLSTARKIEPKIAENLINVEENLQYCQCFCSLQKSEEKGEEKERRSLETEQMEKRAVVQRPTIGFLS